MDQLLVRLLDEGDHHAFFDQSTVREALLREASRQKVAALAANAWQAYLSPANQEWRQRVLAKNWTLHEDRLSKLEQIVRLLEEAGVEVICLKGPATACRYYDPPFLRKSSHDLDFGVRRSHIERAVRALEPLGYRPEPLAKAFACNHHVELDAPDRLHVELHFRLSHGSAGMLIDEFFDRTHNLKLPGGRVVRVLGDADQLLHLLLHAAGSGHKSLFHLIELRRVALANSLEIREQAIRRAIEGHFTGTLAVLDQTFFYYWNEPFTPAGFRLPRTWLGWMIGPDFHFRDRNWKRDESTVTLTAWLRVRLMEVVMTDRPVEAVHLLLRMMTSVWYRLKGSL